MKQIVIIGAAGTGLLMAESILRTGKAEFLGFLDDDIGKQSNGYCGFPVLGKLTSWHIFSGASFLIALYGSKKNRHFFELIKSLEIPENRLASIIDPSAIVMSKVNIGTGVYVGPGTIIEPHTVIASFCALLGNVYIGHDSQLGEFVCCANNVSIGGGVLIGPAAYLGANATIREYTKIGARVIIGMGSVVIKDVPDDETVVGNPAQPIRRQVDNVKI